MSNKQLIRNLRGYLEREFENINQSVIKRHRKITFQKLFYQKVTSLSRKLSYQASLSHLIRITNQKLTRQALCAANRRFYSKLQPLIAGLLRKYFLRNGRRLAVDGSRLPINRKIANKNPEFKLTSSGSYVDALLTTIYDVDKKIPIAWHLSGHHDERKGFLEIADSVLRKGDTIIFDRGYFSNDILKKLHKKGVYFLFRMKKNSSLITNNKNGSWFRHDNIPMKRVSHIPSKTPYHLLTNIRQNSQNIADLYHQRWSVEEYYKLLKGQLSGNFYPQADLQNIYSQLYWQQLVAIINSFFNSPEKEKFINQKALLSHNPKIAYFLAFNTSNALESLLRLVDLLWENCLLPKIPGRHYPRVSILDTGQWYRGKGAVN